MTESILFTMLSLGSLGVISASVLYVVARKFKVDEDPRIDVIDEILPGANCAGCGSPGCRAFAEKLVGTDDISTLFCPVGGNDTMKKVASILGKEVKEQAPQVAVLLCQGSCEVRPSITHYEGPSSCMLSSMIFSGETACEYGCLGHGDCVDACTFGAMYLDEKTHLPVVDSDLCTACGACVTACPKDLLELRPKNKRDLKIYVACKNQDKGGVAKKACNMACIGCSKCAKVCPKDAITVDNFLAYIDAEKCTLCRKCVDECPTHSILETNFPPKKVKKKVEKPEEKTVKTPVMAKAVTDTDSKVDKATRDA